MPEHMIFINLAISFLLRQLLKSVKRAELAGRFQLLAPSLGLNEMQVLSDLPKVMKKIIEEQPNTETTEPSEALKLKGLLSHPRNLKITSL